METLPKSLQESILAALMFDEKYGAAIAVQVTVQHFDDVYQSIARRILGYRKQYRSAPGKTHVDDLFVKELQDNRTGFRRILSGLYSIADGLNGAFIAQRTGEFIRRQELKQSILKASERYQSGGEALVEEVEAILSAGLRNKAAVLSPGVRLSDLGRAFNYLDTNQVICPIGIPTLDGYGIGVVPKEMLLFIAPKGATKTWFCVHMAKQGHVHRQKVLHISLEVRVDVLLGRYHQAFFGASHEPQYNYPRLEFDELKRLAGWQMKSAKPKFYLHDRGVRRRLSAKIKSWGTRLDRLVIQEFPTSQLTVDKLQAYLDYLDEVEKFIPTMMIIDYPDLMRQDKGDVRASLGRTFQEVRGIGVERNMGIIVPTQGQRAAIKARRVRSDMVAEDISKVFTADNVLTFSRTLAEKRFGLGRLSVEHARNSAGEGIELVISQALAVGQWHRRSALLTPSYWDQLNKEPSGGEED